MINSLINLKVRVMGSVLHVWHMVRNKGSCGGRKHLRNMQQHEKGMPFLTIQTAPLWGLGGELSFMPRQSLYKSPRKQTPHCEHSMGYASSH